VNLFTGLKESVHQDLTSDSGLDGDTGDGFRLGPGDDEKFMARALRLAIKGVCTTHPNPVVGSVIVADGVVVGEGWHEIAGEDHAETAALKQAGKRASGATMYVTLEPCSHQGKTPPCVNAIIKAGISRVVIATEDPNPLVNRTGISELQRAGLDVAVGIGQLEAKKINRGFLKRITRGIPWVTMKIATSLDGKTAMANGDSQWITGGAARQDAQKLRAQVSGIVTGIGTVLRDDPNMNVRLEGTQRQPLRIVVDTNLSTPPDAKILSRDGKVLIITASADDSDRERFDENAVEIIDSPIREGRIDLQEMMKELGHRGMNTVLLEAGARLSGSMLEQDLVDELVVYMSPDLLGGDARDMFRIPGLEQISDRVVLEYSDVIMVGRDLRLTLSVSRR
jgi:diaminohydroxyphosphoribosylaminopyrimidine deaminase/5-amino-6-(5-phosphoribosylamino)uracil reductase